MAKNIFISLIYFDTQSLISFITARDYYIYRSFALFILLPTAYNYSIKKDFIARDYIFPI